MYILNIIISPNGRMFTSVNQMRILKNDEVAYIANIH